MADDPLNNTLDAVAPGRSLVQGDVPQALRRRYLTEAGRHGQGLGFYEDATTVIPSFRDRGRQLVATRSDPSSIRDMVAIARHRGRSTVIVKDATGFRREAWLTGQIQGLEVLGYRPTERDQQVLGLRQDAEQSRRDGERARPEARARPRPDPESVVRNRMKVVDAVVRARIVEPDEQARVLAAARARLGELLGRDRDGRQMEAGAIRQRPR
jgi:hypothetical protein